MSYLLDKKIQRNKLFKIAICIVCLLVLFFLRSFIFNGLSYVSLSVFRPVLVLGNKLGEKLKTTGSYFISKNSLFLQNQELQSRLNENEAKEITQAFLKAKFSQVERHIRRLNKIRKLEENS
jgi:cell shape-determining protein MreC